VVTASNEHPALEMAREEGEGHDLLAAAQLAFERGDFKRVRELTARLSQSSQPEIVVAARTLQERVGVDPMQVAVIVVCALFFLWIVYIYVV
jgi:hypothetical protein